MGEEGKDEARPGRLVFTYIVIPGYPYFDVFSGLIGGMVDECIAVMGIKPGGGRGAGRGRRTGGYGYKMAVGYEILCL